MLAVISHPDCLGHDVGPMHPESAARLNAINDQIIMSGMEFVLRHYDAPMATRAQIKLAHDPAYVDRVFEIAPSKGAIALDGDTVMSPGTLKAALRASGAGIMGVDLVMKGEAGPVFCAIRPPGHHAEYDKAMGFCVFNNIAVAAAYALNAYGFKRVAIVDFDVHHGNGTEDIFKNEPRVQFCSSFQHPFYPFTGHESDTPNLVSVPLAASTDGPGFRQAISAHWLPALEAFRPEIIFISAGFDAHISDDMSNLRLTEADYAWITAELLKIAQKHGNGRIVSMLEGGYDLGSMARSVVSHLKALLG